MISWELYGNSGNAVPSGENMGADGPEGMNCCHKLNCLIMLFSKTMRATQNSTRESDLTFAGRPLSSMTENLNGHVVYKL